MTESPVKDRALIWTVNLGEWPLMKMEGIPVLRHMLNALALPELEKVGLMVSPENKKIFEPFANDQVELMASEESDFAQAILMAEDWFDHFEGNVLLLTADLPFISSKLITQLLRCLHSEQAVGCLLTARSDRAQIDQARIIRDADGHIRRLQIFDRPLMQSDKFFELTGYPYLFQWDCLQRALYQVLYKQENARLTDIVEKVTDNGFLVKNISVRTAQPLLRIHSAQDLKWMENGSKNEKVNL